MTTNSRPTTARTTKSHKPTPASYREPVDVHTAPDWTLITASEVCTLARISISTLDKLLALGRFPKPGHHLSKRVWSIRQVQDYCASVAGEGAK